MNLSQLTIQILIFTLNQKEAIKWNTLLKWKRYIQENTVEYPNSFKGDESKSYSIVVETDSYAGNFEREMCAFMTGHIGKCEVGLKE